MAVVFFIDDKSSTFLVNVGAMPLLKKYCKLYCENYQQNRILSIRTGRRALVPASILEQDQN